MSGTNDHFGEMIGYGYSLNGDVDTIITKHSGNSSFIESFEYDELHRMSRWDGISPVDSSYEVYSYDRAGNSTYWKPANRDTGYTFVYFPGTNRLDRIHGVPPSVRDYYSEYDLNGNLIEECHQINGCPLDMPRRYFEQEYRSIASRVVLTGFHWDDYVEYAYDVKLQRIKKMHAVGDSCLCVDPTPREGTGSGGDPGPGKDCVCYDSTKTLYFYTYDGKLIREMVDGVVKRDFIWAGNDRIGVSERVDSTDRFILHYFIKDHLGSTRQLVDSSGSVVAQYDYYPYGTLRRSLGTEDTDIRFTGKRFDDEEVEQYYYGKRYLNGITQRFNSVDPKADEHPGWSPYVYTLCNPVRLVDPNGENPLAGVLLFVSAALDVLDVY
jgi:RHS repeat-associated protein